MTAPTWVPFQPTAQSVRVSASRGQRGRRRLVVVVDQHRNKHFPEGRAWWGYAEKQSSEEAIAPALVGDLYPVATDSHILIRSGQPRKFFRGWSAPWYPPSAYINAGVNLEEGPVLDIKYQVMVTDWTQAHRDYTQRAVQAAVAHALPVPDEGERPDFRVQAIVGRPPMSPRIPQAAMTGHEWLLGFSGDDDRDETLHRLLDVGADMAAIRRAAKEMEAKGARIHESVANEKIVSLEAQLRETQAQMAAMMAEFREQMEKGTPVDVVAAPKKKGPKPKPGTDAVTE